MARLATKSLPLTTPPKKKTTATNTVFNLKSENISRPTAARKKERGKRK
jgi:hypothetical protein